MFSSFTFDLTYFCVEQLIYAKHFQEQLTITILQSKQPTSFSTRGETRQVETIVAIISSFMIETRLRKGWSCQSWRILESLAPTQTLSTRAAAAAAAC